MRWMWIDRVVELVPRERLVASWSFRLKRSERAGGRAGARGGWRVGCAVAAAACLGGCATPAPERGDAVLTIEPSAGFPNSDRWRLALPEVDCSRDGTVEFTIEKPPAKWMMFVLESPQGRVQLGGSRPRVAVRVADSRGRERLELEGVLESKKPSDGDWIMTGQGPNYEAGCKFYHRLTFNGESSIRFDPAEVYLVTVTVSDAGGFEGSLILVPVFQWQFSK